MGYAISWYAFPAAETDAVLKEVRLGTTSEVQAFPEALICSVQLKSGWWILRYNAYSCPFLEGKRLAELSLTRDVVVCRVEEHVMASSAEFWQRGKRTWRIAHEGEAGPKGLDVEGVPPGELAEIRSAMEKKQEDAGGVTADVDYIFEIPLLVAKQLVSFKHDEDCEPQQFGGFVTLARLQSRPGLLDRLLGRKGPR